ncbi:hypothetical protein [Dysgonomonas sp. ZJ709]|uniref:hypothetical protein n=1 Tax=Dysgonomonas sp. ZJ709 TaxID=2709797 RepID=UPI0013EBA6B6|nr:hypothetical protein [Dysgonomonas sp. ZJ709]
MQEEREIRLFQDRIRILFILYIFSDDYSDEQNPHQKKILRTEVKLQKLDFLLRNPDYLAYELLMQVKNNQADKAEIKSIIKEIFLNKEPVLRKMEMTRFLFGAYEHIDDVISFLKSFGLLEFSSKKDNILRTVDKKYYLTDKALEKLKLIDNYNALLWYKKRCLLIKKYFGQFSGSTLKDMQYQIEEYKETAYSDLISDIQNKVYTEFHLIYNEIL